MPGLPPSQRGRGGSGSGVGLAAVRSQWRSITPSRPEALPEAEPLDSAPSPSEPSGTDSAAFAIEAPEISGVTEAPETIAAEPEPPAAEPAPAGESDTSIEPDPEVPPADPPATTRSSNDGVATEALLDSPAAPELAPSIDARDAEAIAAKAAPAEASLNFPLDVSPEAVSELPENPNGETTSGLSAAVESPSGETPDTSDAEVEPIAAVSILDDGTPPPPPEPPAPPVGDSLAPSDSVDPSLGAAEPVSPAAPPAPRGSGDPAMALPAAPGPAAPDNGAGRRRKARRANAAAGTESIAGIALDWTDDPDMDFSMTEPTLSEPLSIEPSAGNPGDPAACPVCGSHAWRPVQEQSHPGLERCSRCQVIRHRERASEPQPLVVRDPALLRLLERAEETATPLRIVNASWVDSHASWNGTARRVESVKPGSAFPEGLADLCLMPFALEQSAHPNRLLSEAHAALKPGGRLFLQAFNPTSLPSLLSGYRWQGLSIPGQVFCFRQRHIEHLLRRAGFRVVSVSKASANWEVASGDGQPPDWFGTLMRTLGNWSAALLFEAVAEPPGRSDAGPEPVR